MPPLQFQPLASQPTPGFWAALTELKLDKLKLDDTAVPIRGWVEAARFIDDKETGREVAFDGAMVVDRASIAAGGDAEPQGIYTERGMLKNFNTIEEFRSVEGKKELFNQVVDQIRTSFDTDEPVFNPFLLVTFADLKKYIFHYWFAFPALVAKPGWELQEPGLVPINVDDVMDLLDVTSQRKFVHGACLVKGVKGQRSVAPLTEASTFFAGTPSSDCGLIFLDPSSEANYPGWPLRNILYYLDHKHSLSALRVFCIRTLSTSRSAWITLPTQQPAKDGGKVAAVGWERTKEDKLASRIADLGPMMDPARLADQAVDLNLKLMRWRILPSLQLDKIASTRCLLLGAGTLGCYVARALMGWGIRNITFVDSARVSYSNPVRQPLFDFEDCLNGGRMKAECAAEKLRRIFPGVNAASHAITIPMPGHPVPSNLVAQTKLDVQKLVELFEAHDAVFLLMDSRESRWLPTLLGAATDKVVMNAALGFDSWLVMRHGGPPDANDAGEQSGGRLGCYYCNDIVAPTDSLTDRTLDQMCTVTRPGIAPIAAASAVELLVSLVQHPEGINAPAETSDTPSGEGKGSPLGAVPHQLRGQLSSWKTLLIEGKAYDRCTACSKIVVDKYKADGIDMLLRAFNETDYLEKLTGLDALHRESEKMMAELEWEEGSEEDF